MLTTLRFLALGAAGALVVIAVALYPVLGSDDVTGPTDSPLVPVLGIVVVGVVVHLLVEAVGYRTRALAPAMSEQDRRARTQGALMSTATLRLALSDAVAFVALASAFVLTTDGFVLYVVGAVVAVALLGLHVYPWSRPLAKVRTSLERDGVSAPVAEVLG